MQLSELGEFGLIKRLRAKCKNVPPEIMAGIGDDAAAIKTGTGKILVTSDMLLEGIHFDLSFTTFRQLGHKFLSVNISDIFAMGGKPKYFFISLGIPGHLKPEDIDNLYSGILKVAKKSGVAVAGGDTCASGDGLVLSGTLIGTADRIITRSGAREGDGIYVTDTLGDSAMGLMILKSQKSEVRSQKFKNKNRNLKFKTQNSKLKTLNSKDVLHLIKKHLMPEPKPLKNTSKVTAMIDISDGLLIDLSHICDESKAGAVIFRDEIPVSAELRHAASISGLDPLDFALRGGEDYVLLFTAPPGVRTGAFKIGEIIKKGRFIIDRKGRKRTFKAEGYEHFK
ncbi:MAG: thiamine-phosphate kinase [Nitrospiraceae bacterium]|nr:MAG: thiamine-phosphate kinase [Nitrospiraceae bacterium]